MTRRRRHGGSAAAGAAGANAEAESEDKHERIAVFEKTKMCKFHILGMCMKGDGCRFAHEKTQLQALPDLARTKLCKTLINTGQCDNPECKYAHNGVELRPVPDTDPERKTTKLPVAPAAAAAAQPRQQQGPPSGTGGPKEMAALAAFTPVFNPSQQAQTAQAAQEAAALFRPGGPLAQYGQPLQDMPTKQKQAAIHQMSQVAQAHAAEAARLHAMAMFLQAHANGQGQGPVPDAAAMGQFLNQTSGGQGQCPQQQQDKPAASNNAPPAQAGDGAQGPKPQSDYARVGLPQSANSAGSANSDLAATMSRVLSRVPVQINTDTLRSMSSCSLHRLGDQSDADEELPGDAEGGKSPDNAKHFLTYSGSSQGVQTPSPDRCTAAAGGSKNPDASAALAQAFTSVNDVMTVKNTFLDFGPHTPMPGVLRSVQTASGRLDLMSQQA